VQTENSTATASVTTVLLSTTTRQISGYQNYQNGQKLLFSGQNFFNRSFLRISRGFPKNQEIQEIQEIQGIQ
jgi:hypothetical protein